MMASFPSNFLAVARSTAVNRDSSQLYEAQYSDDLPISSWPMCTPSTPAALKVVHNQYMFLDNGHFQ
jgi:hypothetical protein